jgi:hypothetical protein
MEVLNCRFSPSENDINSLRDICADKINHIDEKYGFKEGGRVVEETTDDDDKLRCWTK